MTNDDELLVAVGLTLVVHRCQRAAAHVKVFCRVALAPAPASASNGAYKSTWKQRACGLFTATATACSQALRSRSRSSEYECESVSAYSYAEQRLFGKPLQELHLQFDRLRHVRDEHVQQEREEDHRAADALTSRDTCTLT